MNGIWSFLWFDSSTQMEMLRKIIDCNSLENFPKNIYGGVRFSKIASLCCTNCSCTITSDHHRYFSEYVPKNYILSSTTEFSPRGFCMIALYKISEKFLWDIFLISYLTLTNKVAGFQCLGCNFTEKEVFDKNILNLLLTLQKQPLEVFCKKRCS